MPVPADFRAVWRAAATATGAGLTMLVLGCQGGGADRQPKATPTPTPPPAAGGITWTVPEDWLQRSPSGMRSATYVVPGVAGRGDAECVVFYFGNGRPGTIDANVERWKARFTGIPSIQRVSFDHDGLRRTDVEIRGIHEPPGGGGEKGAQESLLLATVVEGPAGPVYFRCVGPAATMEATMPSFERLTASIRPR